MNEEDIEISGVHGQEKGLNQRQAAPVKWTRRKKKKAPDPKKSRNNIKLPNESSANKQTLNDKEPTELAGTDNSLTPKANLEMIHQIDLQLGSQYPTSEGFDAKLQALGSKGSPRTQRLSMAISRDDNELVDGGFSSRVPSPKEVTLSPRSNEPQKQKSPPKLQGKHQAPVKSKNNLNFLTRNNHVTSEPIRDEKDIQIVKRIVL